MTCLYFILFEFNSFWVQTPGLRGEVGPKGESGRDAIDGRDGSKGDKGHQGENSSSQHSFKVSEFNSHIIPPDYSR